MTTKIVTRQDAAVLLTDPDMRCWLDPFMKGDVSLSDVADASGLSLSTLHYRVQKVQDLELLSRA